MQHVNLSHFIKQVAACLGLVLALAGTVQAATVTPVPQVDLDRYIGRWYEIAHNPMFFQRHCTSGTTATYTKEPDGRIGVHNRCNTADGVQQANGHARVVEGSNNAKLKVTFFWPFSGDYWVIGLDPDYRWAVVGEPGRDYLWVLSRTRVLPSDQLQLALKSATDQGYDLRKLVYTPQPKSD